MDVFVQVRVRTYATDMVRDYFASARMFRRSPMHTLTRHTRHGMFTVYSIWPGNLFTCR